MSDPKVDDRSGELGAWARILLAEANDATLLLTESVAASEPAASVHDEDGIPHVWCADGSKVAAAARRHSPAVLTVAAAGDVHIPVTLVLIGRLGYITSTISRGRHVAVVELTPARVSIDVGRAPDLTSHHVPLEEYLRRAPDAVAGYATRLVEHTNSRHQRELCAYVSQRFGLSASVVAGVLLTTIDRHGATLRWVDAAGAHTTALMFDRPATGPADLADQLLSQLSNPGLPSTH